MTGDPKRGRNTLHSVTAFVGENPVFGICLGLQIVARVLGCDTYKLTFGHHGANQPVKNLPTGRMHITTQNHDFTVAKDAMESKATLTQLNANDLTVEGF